MSRLSDIIDAATSDTTSVAALLRMTTVVASRMSNPPLLDWVENELSGYAEDAQLPAYRGPFQTQVVSDWSGPFNSIVRNAPFPSLAFPEALRDAGAFQAEFRESVSELAQLAQSDTQLAYSWGTDAIAQLNAEMLAGRLRNLQQIAPLHGIVAVRRLVSPALIGAVLDNVRTRVLNLALNLEKIAPDAGEPGAPRIDPTTVKSIVTTHVYGQGNTVAVDSAGAVRVGTAEFADLAGLLTAARNAGLGAEGVAQLEEAIEGDAADSGTPAGKPGHRVRRFLGKATLGGMKAAGSDALHEGVNTLGDLVRAYYGI